MTEPRPWPNFAQTARNQVSELALNAIGELHPVVVNHRRFTETDLIKRLASIEIALYRIVRWMESVGAETRPVPDTE